MNKLRWAVFFMAFIFAFFLLSASGIRKPAGVSRPLLWKVEELDLTKIKGVASQTYKKIITEAESYCVKRPVVVTDKKKTVAPDKHYYCSVGPYWWPDPQNPQGKYINKDGQINPEYYEYDAQIMDELVKRCTILSKAYYLTGNKKYYKSYIKQLKAWFVNRKTFMYPSFEYAQVIRGHNDNKGRSTGTIEAYKFHDIIESIRLVNTIRPMNDGMLQRLQQWFFDFGSWMEDTYGSSLKNVQANVSLAFDVTLVDMYLFAGEKVKAAEIANTFAERRVYTQIEENGKQPAELKRANSLSYSIFNFTHILDFCCICEQVVPSFYEQHQERLDAAIRFMIQSVEKPQDFEYSQTTGFDNSRKNLQTIISRRNSILDEEKRISYSTFSNSPK